MATVSPFIPYASLPLYQAAEKIVRHKSANWQPPTDGSSVEAPADDITAISAEMERQSRELLRTLQTAKWFSPKDYCDPGTYGIGDAGDDTAAWQACWRDCAAADGVFFEPACPVYVKLTGTVEYTKYQKNADGSDQLDGNGNRQLSYEQVRMVWVQAGNAGQYGSPIEYHGPSNSLCFSWPAGLTNSYLNGPRVKGVVDGKDNITLFDLNSTNGICNSNVFVGIRTKLTAGTNCRHWCFDRVGAGDLSIITMVNCKGEGAGRDVAGQQYLAWLGQNGFLLGMHECFWSDMALGVSNVDVATGRQGGAGLKFDNCGSTRMGVDYRLGTAGAYDISGIYELGQRILETTASAEGSVIRLYTQLRGYHPKPDGGGNPDGVLIACQSACSLQWGGSCDSYDMNQPDRTWQYDERTIFMVAAGSRGSVRFDLDIYAKPGIETLCRPIFYGTGQGVDQSDFIDIYNDNLRLLNEIGAPRNGRLPERVLRRTASDYTLSGGDDVRGLLLGGGSLSLPAANAWWSDMPPVGSKTSIVTKAAVSVVVPSGVTLTAAPRFTVSGSGGQPDTYQLPARCTATLLHDSQTAWLLAD